MIPAGWCGVCGTALGLFASRALYEQRVPTYLEGAAALGCVSAAVYLGASRRKLPTQALVTSSALGIVGGYGLQLALSPVSPHWRLGAYGASLAFFHLSEFLVTAQYNSGTLSFDSFLVNHSWSYGLAALASWTEYGAESYFVPWIKLDVISYVGLALVILGDGFRKLAMITAANNFNHIVAVEKKEDHKLVTHGIYRFCRHPSYAGWFWWALGSQILLANPVCTVAYGLASYQFFVDRVEEEERHLLTFFGSSYDKYQQRVPSGVPFVRGFRVSDSVRKWWLAQEGSGPGTHQ